MSLWQVQEAKARLSEVIEDAQTLGPQIISKHGVERAVVLSIAEYRGLTKGKRDFKSWILNGPKFDDFEIERNRDTGREIEL